MTIRSILCPVDLSPVSGSILRAALALGQSERATVTVLHVLEPLLAQASAIAFTTRALEDMAREELETLIRRVTGDAASAPESVVRDVRCGEPDATILAAAKEHGADLIVMGTQGFTGVRKLFFGSTAAHVLAKSPVPVLAIPPQATTAGTAPSGHPLGLQRILVGVDFSEASRRAIEAAADLARRWQLALLLVHVEPPAPALERWAELLDEHQERRVEQARRELELIAREIHGVGVTTSTVGGRVEDVLVQAVDEHPGTLLVLGLARSQQTRAEFRLGSTAYRLMCLSRAPVLSIPRT